MNKNTNTSVTKTSWTYKELESLCVAENHKITSDGFDFRWYHKITGKWEIHSIKYFEDYKQPHSWLKYNLYKWSEELMCKKRSK